MCYDIRSIIYDKSEVLIKSSMKLIEYDMTNKVNGIFL